MRLQFIFCAAMFGFPGCGGAPEDMPELGDVSGTVTLNGQPVVGALVEFRPKESGRPSAATTDSEGYYSLEYTADYSGAAVGQHSIFVTPIEGDDEDYEYDKEGDSTQGFPPKATYGSMTFEVKAGSNEKNINL